MVKKISRRSFVYLSIAVSVLIFLYGKLFFRSKEKNEGYTSKNIVEKNIQNIGIASDGKSYVYIAKNGSPEENTRKVIEMMGGIEKYIEPTDVVLLKPNSQWWNQGMTNTNSMKAFIEMVLKLPGFEGEIIIADNHQFPDDNSRGWTTLKRNGDFNYNELVNHFQKKGYSNVNKSHWHCGGPSKPNSWGGAENGGVVENPEDGDGYVWRSDLVYTAPNGRKSMMSYPIFTSPYSGTKIDFHKGLWKDGKYIDRKLKFINFSVLNHHSSYVGVTGSIKNYLGICDMTCGDPGVKPKGYNNFHFVGFSNLHWRAKNIFEHFGWREKTPSMGGCVGFFMKNVRMADINIITAEWVGYGSRTDLKLREHTKTIIASTDPVALDYVAARDILLPATKKNNNGKPFIEHNDPIPDKSPFKQFLISCHEIGIGNISSNKIEKIVFNFV